MSGAIVRGLTIHEIDTIDDALRNARQMVALAAFALRGAARDDDSRHEHDALDGLARLLEAAQKDIQTVEATIYSSEGMPKGEPS